MKSVRVFSLAAAALLASVCARAQMPTDNDTWKARCQVLRNADPTGRGAVPGWLASAPGPTPGPRFTTFGFDRSRAGQHWVACTFFYLGAIADHNAPPSHANKVHAHESAVMGRIEAKMRTHEPITEREKMTKMHAEAAEIPKPALTVPEEEAMLQAAVTMPLQPPSPAPPPAKPRPDVRR